MTGILHARLAILGRRLALLATYAVVAGALSVVINVTAAVDGEVPAIGRVIMGLWGLAAGLLLWTGRGAGIGGWSAVMVWAALQIPLVAWNTEGSPTTQLFEFPLSASSRTTVNGKVTSYSEYGINLVGVGLAVWAASVRDRWARQVAPPARMDTESTYAIEHRAPDRAPQVLGSVGDN